MKKSKYKIISFLCMCILIAFTMTFHAFQVQAAENENANIVFGFDSSGDGWRYSDSEKTLYLTNTNLNCIYVNGVSSISIVVSGNNRVNHILSRGCNLNLKGNGRLKVLSYFGGNNITITSCEVETNCSIRDIKSISNAKVTVNWMPSDNPENINEGLELKNGARIQSSTISINNVPGLALMAYGSVISNSKISIYGNCDGIDFGDTRHISKVSSSTINAKCSGTAIIMDGLGSNKGKLYFTNSNIAFTEIKGSKSKDKYGMTQIGVPAYFTKTNVKISAINNAFHTNRNVSINGGKWNVSSSKGQGINFCSSGSKKNTYVFKNASIRSICYSKNLSALSFEGVRKITMRKCTFELENKKKGEAIWDPNLFRKKVKGVKIVCGSSKKTAKTRTKGFYSKYLRYVKIIKK